jgi:pimeloyl-ACP methyl ester carboxylesterase
MTSGARPLLFIHGMYMNALSWQPWVDRAAGAGLRAEAVSWPFHEGDPEALRARVDPALGRLTLHDVIEHHKQLIDALPERPLLVGHSIGGLVVQKLVNDGYAAAAVAISPAPPRGLVSLSPHFLAANFPHVNPLAGNRPVVMTPRRFHYTFGNTLSRADSDELFERYVVPESRNVPRQTLTRHGSVDFRRAHVPLLLLTGDQDHLTPLDAVRRNARAYQGNAGPVELEVFAGRCHAICLQQGWEDLADVAFDFLKNA